MEELRKRSFILGGLLVLIGAFFILSPKQSYADKTELWMEQKAPRIVGDYVMEPNNINPSLGYTYKMDDSTYETLKPYGIVARRYTGKGKNFDVILIASRSKDSFHDPTVCFTAQGWTFDQQQEIQIDTDRGKIPATFVEMRSKTSGKAIALFFYRGPHDYYPSTDTIRRGLFFEQLKGSKDVDGVFYRFIPNHQNATKEELLDFVRQYLIEAKKTSGGYF